MNNCNGVVMVYLTCANRDEADKIAIRLVQQRLAACVNILGEIQSLYEWKGRIEKSSEIAVVAKTTADRFAALEHEVKKLHSYENPCIVSWLIELGHTPFLEWVRASVKE